MEITEDIVTCRDGIWSQRNVILEALFMGEPGCFANRVNAAGIRLVGWSVASFKVAALLNDRSVLDDAP